MKAFALTVAFTAMITIGVIIGAVYDIIKYNVCKSA